MTFRIKYDGKVQFKSSGVTFLNTLDDWCLIKATCAPREMSDVAAENMETARAMLI